MPPKEFRFVFGCPLAIFVALTFCQLLMGAQAFSQTLSTLHHFNAQSGGTIPLQGRLLADASGNLYGATNYGGTANDGTVFELSPPITGGAWTETVLYSFTGGTDGRSPIAGLVADSAGNLYGATNYGGTAGEYGVVFQLVRPTTTGGAWTENVLYRFQGGTNDGIFPGGGLIFDAAGNLYGETGFGGACNDGTIFQLSPPASQAAAWTETILYSFQYACNGKDGHVPTGGLVFGKGGALFGVTSFGTIVGVPSGGTVFQLQPPTAGHPQWTEQVLHSFTGGSDGYNPYGGATVDSKGNLYGTTAMAGGSDGTHCTGTNGCGVVFELSPPAVAGGAWIETVLHVFTGGNDGASPFARVIFDRNGNLYGTAANGGTGTCGGSTEGGCGAVFKLTPPSSGGGAWTETTLHTFTGAVADEGLPYAGVTFGKNGRLYGATSGNNGAKPRQFGTVYKIVP
jgi:uncharacterized repeat protein (TIGR03803 family)